MSVFRPILLCLALAASTTSALAADFPLSFTADGSSRWYEFYTDSFAQLDKGYDGNPALDGFFRISAESDPFNPRVFQQTGASANVFPSEAAFANIGVLSYAGSGNGTFPITGVTLNVSPYVDAREGVLGAPYRTTVSNAVGTITIANGRAIDIQLAADILFEIDVNYIPSMGWIPYRGRLAMTGQRFGIFVDDSYTFTHGVLRYVWDLLGAVDGVAGDAIFASGFESS
jgi:hypothetical protein